MRPTRSLLFLAGIAAVLAGSVSPAGAAYNGGVKSVQASAVDIECIEGQALPCPPGAGYGPSNTIAIGQSVVGGERVFDQIFGYSQYSDAVWLQTRIGAECKTGYRLEDIDVYEGAETADFRLAPNVPQQIQPETWIDIPHPDAKTMPVTDVPIQLPLLRTLANLPVGDPDGLLALGEAEVDSRVAAGQDEDTVRTEGFTVETDFPMVVRVQCEGIVRGVKWVKKITLHIPLRLEFLGYELQSGVGDQPGPGGVAADPAVLQANLSVLPDPDDSCVVHASGVFVTNQPMTVGYRLVNGLGQRSQLFSVDVDQTLTAFFSHPVAVPTAGGGDGPTGLVNPDDDGLDLTARPPGLGTDSIQVEVVSPHAFQSNVDHYSAPPCSPDPVRTFDVPVTEFTDGGPEL